MKKTKATIKSAFILAETLITLSILGVVAALTIPSLVHKFQDRIAISQFKRAVSLIDGALNQMYLIEGLPNTYDWPNKNNVGADANFIYFSEKLSKYLDVTKICTLYIADKCIKLGNPLISNDNGGNEYYYYRSFSDPSIESHRAAQPGLIVLKNGMYISYDESRVLYLNGVGADSNFKVYGAFRVDVNGKKGPNRIGYDVFYLDFGSQGILTKIPQTDNGGNFGSTNNKGAVFYKQYCNKNANNDKYDGYSCSTWIMRHNNMDYKYRDVSAEW